MNKVSFKDPLPSEQGHGLQYRIFESSKWGRDNIMLHLFSGGRAYLVEQLYWGFPGGSDGKKTACNSVEQLY